MEEKEVEKEELQQDESVVEVQHEQQNVDLVQEKPAKSFFSRLVKKHKQKKEEKRKQLENEKLSEEETKKVEEKLVVANEEVKQKSEKKKRIKNLIFFLINIVLVAGILVWNVFSSEDFVALDITQVKFEFILIMLTLLLLVNLCDVSTVHRMIYRKTLRSRWALAYKSTATLRYYDAITPMSTGGQPFMVTYLTSRDVAGSTALSIPISKMIFQNISWLIVTGFCLIYSFATGMSSLVSIASIIGFLLCFLLVAVVLFFSLSKKVGHKLVVWGLKLLTKMKVVKNYDKQYTKVMNFIDDYQAIMKEYSKAKWDVFYQMVLHIIRNVCLYSIPYFIYLSFPHVVGATEGSFVDLFVYAGMIDLASSFIPLPGGTGMNEITFTALFTQYLKGYTFWALLLWRFCSYYFYLLQGIGLIAYDTLYGNRKYRWIKAKRELQAESQEFRRAQIEQFRRERSRRRKQKV